MNKINIAYIRVSSDAQQTDLQYDSIKEYCKREKVVIDRYIEDHGQSAYKLNIEERTSLMEIKKLALDKKINNLYIYSSDRLARRTEGAMFLKFLASCGVKVISMLEGDLYKNEDIDELLSFIRFYQNQTESKKTSERVRSSKKVCTENGAWLGGTVPFGYKIEDNKLKIYPIEAEIVKQLYNTYIISGTKDCLKFLNNNKILTRKGNKWSRARLLSFLKNSLHYGQRQGKNSFPFDHNLAIIPKETYLQAMDIMKKRTNERNKHTSYTNRSNILLESLMYHTVNGELHKLHIDYYRKTPNEKYVSYRCSKCKQNGIKGIKSTYSNNKYFPIIENKVIEILNSLSIEEIEAKYCQKKAIILVSIENKITEKTKTLELKRKALKNANITLEKVFTGELTIDISVIANKIKDIQTDIIELEKQLKELKDQLKHEQMEEIKKAKLTERFKEIKEIYHTVSDKDKKRILQELINKVIIDSEGDTETIEIKLNI